MKWRKSTYSGTNGNCTEVARDGKTVLVRDSKNPDGPGLTFTLAAWKSFVRKTGR